MVVIQPQVTAGIQLDVADHVMEVVEVDVIQDVRDAKVDALELVEQPVHQGAAAEVAAVVVSEVALVAHALEVVIHVQVVVPDAVDMEPEDLAVVLPVIVQVILIVVLIVTRFVLGVLEIVIHRVVIHVTEIVEMIAVTDVRERVMEDATVNALTLVLEDVREVVVITAENHALLHVMDAHHALEIVRIPAMTNAIQVVIHHAVLNARDRV